jgi:hypothetical protein
MRIFRIPVTQSERAGATDANCTRIVSIDPYDSLGSNGCAREEFSGENAPALPDDLLGHLADNRAWQLGRGGTREH